MTHKKKIFWLVIVGIIVAAAMTSEFKNMFAQVFGSIEVDGIVESAHPLEIEGTKPQLLIEYSYMRRGLKHKHIVTFPTDSTYQKGDTLVIKSFSPSTDQHELLYNKSAMHRAKTPFN